MCVCGDGRKRRVPSKALSGKIAKLARTKKSVHLPKIAKQKHLLRRTGPLENGLQEVQAGPGRLRNVERESEIV